MVKAKKPRRIVMLAYDGAQMLDITGPLQIIAGVNDEFPEPVYELTLLAAKRGPLRTSSGVKLVADGSYADLPANIDTLMVAGGDFTPERLRDEALMKAVKLGASRARRTVSICTGAFFLAAAGLLDGKRATTHWRSTDLLARHFPKITVERDAIYVREGNLWTSAGVTAGMDLALALVREDHGDAMALTIARRHVMFMMRPGGQSQFSTHLEPEANSTGRLAKILRWIPEHVDGELDVAALAKSAGMSERNFARAFARETGDTPARYVERARLEAARRLLTGSALPVSIVASRAGFGSEERMRRVFQRHLKISPGVFRARFKGEHP